ncbi:hypothetical protein J8I87_41405 [Paraburkholderia sp. LEh10]|jgi:hypothetical protein|uniref:DUF7710 domain-containing protein n=1 Tax=Paraburkholderia sp. LEh10 TaxID=2821353 RepID=UPI001AE98E78|nr:hypothetical protein [Paraburkholderia sp. LEh10]MBP0595968.1 hypothetical protein [Paraburkholderia sp. LEh10]
MNVESGFIWVFVGEGARFPSGVFTVLDVAKAWIASNQLTGVLTRYPLNEGVYDWATSHGLFTPKKPEHSSPFFIGKFTIASMEHFHFENGLMD